MYKKIVNAYDILSNPIKRNEYNLELELEKTISILNITDIYKYLWKN